MKLLKCMVYFSFVTHLSMPCFSIPPVKHTEKLSLALQNEEDQFEKFIQGPLSHIQDLEEDAKKRITEAFEVSVSEGYEVDRLNNREIGRFRDIILESGVKVQIYNVSSPSNFIAPIDIYISGSSRETSLTISIRKVDDEIDQGSTEGLLEEARNQLDNLLNRRLITPIDLAKMLGALKACYTSPLYFLEA